MRDGAAKRIDVRIAVLVGRFGTCLRTVKRVVLA